MVNYLLSLLGFLQFPLISGFVPALPAKQCRISADVSKTTIGRPTPPTASSLYMDLWERMEIDEDDEPYWYLLNCVAGLEMDLLRQVRQVAEDLPQEDVVKFVVPTEIKTRSHGANRMVRETKTKYQGYVFAKLRLTKETYESIKKIDLCRSWMGTINMKGYKKLPPAPLPLSEEEIENFDLENPKWEIDEEDVSVDEAGQDIIVDTHENDVKEMEEEEAIEIEVKTVYKSLKVEDMIKVTAKNKFNGEDGIVKRLKEGKVLIRFFTYGQTFDEWLDPSDVRKLTDDEILKGLGGPSAPITQRDIDGPKEDEERRGIQDSRNSVGAFGGGPSRDRRQDREERRFRRDPISERKERENWNWYKETEERNQGGAYDDGDGVEFRAQSRGRGNNDRNNFWAEGDVDSQWGRNKGKPKRQQQQQDEDDWSSFVSQGDGGKSKSKNAPSKEETDDFFASLMTDLSKDVDNEGRGQPQQPAAADDDDDFFASLMSEIEDKPSGRTPQSSAPPSNDDDDDFFASLEREIRGADSNKPQKKSKPAPAPAASEEDDFFASLEMELASDLDAEPAASAPPAAANDDGDDFFSSLEAELETDLDTEDTIPAPAVAAPPAPKSALDAASLKKKTVPELKDILRDRGLKVSGKKSELIERITSA